jgi:benzoyl-CoA reductase/2-hydroxyglutaryl-CoA dehydratase subunit BcrC/BadD/HgdB
MAWFHDMIDHCYEYAVTAKQEGKKIVGIMCEYTPRELIMAAGGVPVCLCGGDADMIIPAEEDLPANLCPLIKSTYGYHREHANPFLEMADLIVAETTCDGKKKMFELMGETRPMYILELPQKADDPDAFEHWVAELRKLKKALEDRFETVITDEDIRNALSVMNHERMMRRLLAESMRAAIPPLSGRELLDLKSIISCIPADLEQYEKIMAFLARRPRIPERLQDVRVLLTGVPVVHGAERVVDIIEDHGGIIVCAENCTGLKPILEDVDQDGDDPLRALAEKYFNLHCSVMTINDRRLTWLKKLADDYSPECIIELVWHACLTYDVESYRVKKYAQEKLQIPYLRIETDYAPSDSARIAVRVEALFETVKAQRPNQCFCGNDCTK